jgi:hypothetical protein
MNVEWSRRLGAGYFAQTGRKRAVRFPGEESFKIDGDDDVARLHLPVTAVISNMQSNASAFESWCLALHRWCGARVVLSWDEPASETKETRNAHRHYQRFLYRLHRFNSLFGASWFSVDDAMGALGRGKVVASSRTLWLNTSGAKAKAMPEAEAPWTEDRWECHLASREVRHLDRKLGLSSETIKHQQIPVGLFANPIPSDAAAIFPGAKSAIDIVALDHGNLWLVELKRDGNVGFGALSELLFYTWVIRDAARGLFDFARSKPNARVQLGRTELSAINTINGVLLAPTFHPLIDSTLLSLIAQATAKAWAGEGPSLRFSQHQFDPDTWKSITA